jgi:ABC-type oligopeptide transport system substrate-binding subunit
VTIQALINNGPDLLDVLLPGKALLSRAKVAAPETGSLLKQLDELVERQYKRSEGLGQRRLFQQFANVLHEIVGTCPLLLVLDDMQWADTASISLLFNLGRQLQGSSILIACAYRPEEVALGRDGERHPLEKVLGEFKRQFGDVWTNLGQTEETQGQEFVDAYLDTQPNRLGEDFREALLQHTGGHPLFTIELLRAMQERGDLVQERGAWIDKPSLNWNMLPARIEGVIEERTGALDDELLEILNVACVEGEEFNAQIIARVQNTSEIKVLSRLSKELERRHHLVREIGEVRAGGTMLSRFKFSHTLIHRYLYNQLGAGERRLIHAEIGSILEDLYAGQSEDIAVQLTHHFQEAGTPDRALPYMIQAGDKARSLYANAEAEMYYKRAAAIQQKRGWDEEAARTLLKLGLVYTAAYESEKAQESYDQAFILWNPLRESTDLPDLQAPTAVLQFALEEPRTLDPGVAEDDVSALLVAQLFEGLVRIGRDYNILPAVATRWDVNEEGTKYVFHIKEDVHWNDGTQLTAADFEYAWKRNLNLTEESPATSLLYAIKNAQTFREGDLNDPGQVGVRALNDFTLEVCLEDPTPYFPYLLAHTALYPLPRWALERYGSEWAQYQNLVTNGPYELAEWKSGERLTLAKNPLYHEEFGGNVQKVECLIFESFNEQTLELYDADNLDAVSLLNADPGALAQAMNAHPDEFVKIPRPSNLYLSFRTDIPPFDDVRLRRAFVHAVDRDELEAKVYRGSHMAATGGFVPPGMVGHSPGIGLVYDPDLARRLLSEAGYPNGKGFPEITWLHPTASKDERLIPFLRSSWRENLGNARFDTLVETAKRITDQGNRMELYREADRDGCWSSPGFLFPVLSLSKCLSTDSL